MPIIESPIYSAIKIDGRKLYDYARSGQAVEVPKRQMRFYDVQLLGVEGNFVDVELKCSKGSYIRSWAEALGRELGCGGTVAELRRTFSAPFNVNQAISMDELVSAVEGAAAGASSDKAGSETGLGATAAWQQGFVPLAQALPHWRAVLVTGRDEQLMSNGQISHDLQQRLVFEVRTANEQKQDVGIRVVRAANSQLLALLQARPQQGLKIRRIFRTECD